MAFRETRSDGADRRTGPITLDESSLARTAVLEGVGLGFFMEQDVRADIEAGRLVRVLEDWTPPLAGLCLYYPGRRNPSAALKAFIGLAREFSARTRELYADGRNNDWGNPPEETRHL